MDAKLEAFIDGFTDHGAGCRRQCYCGKNYYNGSGDWDWEPGELEALEADKESIAIPHPIGCVYFEGREYAIDCDCWHNRARQIMGFLDSHKGRIAEYFAAEKKRLQALTDSVPVIR